MNAGQSIADAVAERWLARALESYPAAVRGSLAGGEDPFRNPTGHALRNSLRKLAAEVLGEMDSAAVAEALDAVIRLRAVQDFRPAQAIGFIFDLRNAAAEVPGVDSHLLQERIDELALLGFDQYMNCREQIFKLRVKELRLREPAEVEQ